MIAPAFVGFPFAPEGPSWRPDRLSGLALWLDAAWGLTVDGSGRVTSWASRVGGLAATQGTTGQMPVVATSVAGLPAPIWDGADDSLVVASWAAPAAYTLFAVSRLDAAPGVGSTRNLVGNRSQPAGGRWAQVRVQESTGRYGLITVDSADAATFSSLGPAYALGSARRLTVWRSASQMALASSPGGVATVEANVAIQNAPTSSLIVGSDGGNPWSGAICELAIYSRVLSAAERAAVEGYLDAKWRAA